MKYLRSTKFGILIFECNKKHSEIASALGLQEEDILSAGFLDCADPSQIACKGQSTSLVKAAGPMDARLIQINIEVGRSLGG